MTSLQVTNNIVFMLERGGLGIAEPLQLLHIQMLHVRGACCGNPGLTSDKQMGGGDLSPLAAHSIGRADRAATDCCR